MLFLALYCQSVPAKAHGEIPAQGALRVGEILPEMRMVGNHIRMEDNSIFRFAGKQECRQYTEEAKIDNALDGSVPGRQQLV